MFVCFSLLGIGNTLIQVSLNPLVSDVVTNEKLASTLTLGQFIKAIASFMAPLLAAWSVIRFEDWKWMFPIMGFIALIAFIYLFMTPIEERKRTEKMSSFTECFHLLGDSFTFFLFVGILVHVGIDVGTTLTVPKLLMEKADMTLANAGYVVSLYFLCRTIGCFSGTFLLTQIPVKPFFIISTLLMTLGTAGLLVASSPTLIYICVGLLGIGNSNIFPIIFSQALLHRPDKNNEISGLLVMGISGGAIFPVFMGMASDAIGTQTGAIIILALCVAWLLFLSTKIN